MDGAHARQFLLAHDEPLREVHLVPQEHDWDVADLFADHLDPVVQVVEGVFASHVADRDDTVGALEVRVPEQSPKPFFTHDVPHHHVERRGCTAPHHVDRLLRDLRADRRDVSVVEFVLDEAFDQGGLPDCHVPDQAHLRFEAFLPDNGGRGHHASPIEHGLMYREDASIAPDKYSWSPLTAWVVKLPPKVRPARAA